MDQVGRLLVKLAADEEFFGPLIAEIPVDAPGDRWLVRPLPGRPMQCSGIQRYLLRPGAGRR